ncbi:unnamed protein product, partial [Urochloa humidicola]
PSRPARLPAAHQSRRRSPPSSPPSFPAAAQVHSLPFVLPNGLPTAAAAASERAPCPLLELRRPPPSRLPTFDSGSDADPDTAMPHRHHDETGNGISTLHLVSDEDKEVNGEDEAERKERDMMAGEAVGRRSITLPWQCGPPLRRRCE